MNIFVQLQSLRLRYIHVRTFMRIIEANCLQRYTQNVYIPQVLCTIFKYHIQICSLLYEDNNHLYSEGIYASDMIKTSNQLEPYAT